MSFLRPSRRRFVALGLLLVAACGRDAPAPDRAPSAPARPPRPGIVLILVDTLRADAVAPAEGGATHMPSLHTFAQGATSFVDAVSSGSWTPQAVPSILTGLTPQHTGCQGVGEEAMPPLPGGVLTLAERLRTVGYATAAYTGGGWLSASQGLAQGFDTFVSSFDTLGPEACVKAWADERRADAPFLLLLHTYAPHDPYGNKDPRAMASAAPALVPPSPTIARVFHAPAGERDVGRALAEPGVLRECAFEWYFDGPARPAASLLLARTDPSKTLAHALRRFVDGGYLADDQGRAAIEARFRSAYEQGLVLTDAILARTFAALEAARLPGDTIVIVTSDHGEAFGEHGYLTHERWMHDEIARVPLLIRAPGRMPVGAAVRGTCGPVDLTPTLLELAQVPSFADEIDGRSLVALANGRAGGHPVVATVDRHEAVAGARRHVRELRVESDRWTWSYVFDIETGALVREQVFDRVADPRRLDPRALGELGTDDPELCRVVTSTRDGSRRRFGLSLTAPLCGTSR